MDCVNYYMGSLFHRGVPNVPNDLNLISAITLQTMKIILVAGARPNFMKIAPIIRAIKSFNKMNHTNQTNLSRLPCLPRETVLLFHWGNAVYGACPVAKAYGMKCIRYFTGTRETK